MDEVKSELCMYPNLANVKGIYDLPSADSSQPNHKFQITLIAINNDQHY